MRISFVFSSGVYSYPGQRVERVQAVHGVQGAPQPPENAVSPGGHLHLPTQESFRKQGELFFSFVRLSACTFILVAVWSETTATRPFQLEEAIEPTQSQVVRSQMLVRRIRQWKSHKNEFVLSRLAELWNPAVYQRSFGDTPPTPSVIECPAGCHGVIIAFVVRKSSSLTPSLSLSHMVFIPFTPTSLWCLLLTSVLCLVG